jgi:hypothetical protein
VTAAPAMTPVPEDSPITYGQVEASETVSTPAAVAATAAPGTQPAVADATPAP